MEKGNWIKKHPVWTGIIGIVGFFFLISLLVGNVVEEGINKKIIIDDTSEQDYLDFMYEFSLVITDTASLVTDISYMGANSEITIYQAGLLYEKTEDVYKEALITLDTIEVPNKFKLYHKHYRSAVVYMIDAMDLASKGCYTNNVDLINKGTSKISMATLEIDTATQILERII